MKFLTFLILLSGFLLQIHSEENEQHKNKEHFPQRPADPNHHSPKEELNLDSVPNSNLSITSKTSNSTTSETNNSTTSETNNLTPETIISIPTVKSKKIAQKSDPYTVDYNLGPAQCLKQKYTRLSCAKVFCPPWMRCLSGECVCKIPYKCPKQETRVCGLDTSSYSSMCQAKAISCRTKQALFSHFSSNCEGKDKVEVSLKDLGSDQIVEISAGEELGKMLVCAKNWDMAAANVVCRNTHPRGAEAAGKIKFNSINETLNWSQCVSVQCSGSELSLAECVIYKPTTLKSNTNVATLKCYEEPAGECKKFSCVNGKCIALGKTCNGVDDCGDNSDEMCCKGCQNSGFHCSSGVCIPDHAVKDGIRDCLGGEDELDQQKPQTNDEMLSDPKSEIRSIRKAAESQLECGIPNMDYIYRSEDTTDHHRQKRLVGGEEALPTQIQWQVAVQDEGSIHCGGVYLGGCWVLTAAHCVRPKPKSFRIKFSLWRKHGKQSTTDSIGVKNIIIHHQYNAQTYENDIALIQLEELNLSDKCMKDNPAVRAVCVPWSTEQFQPNHTCTISGWGRNREGRSIFTLNWANVTLISNCEKYYNQRFRPGMECAGDLDGNVDSCQGDSGGPLVCKDASGVSYVWGIVSWGDKCGEPNHPGVYTKVAHYFEWIRFQTGWPAVTKYNQ